MAQKAAVLPSSEELEQMKVATRYRNRYVWSLKSTVYSLVTVAAAAILIAVLLMPVLRIYGTSMNPTLTEGDFVLSVKSSSMETGDVLAFYYNNKVLIKRVIAQPGQWVDISEDGTVYVDNIKIDEPYLKEKALGECDLELPYQVPESRIFVMGDNRESSVDSRSSTIGCVAEEQIVGKIVFCIWPVSNFGPVGKGQRAKPGTAKSGPNKVQQQQESSEEELLQEEAQRVEAAETTATVRDDGSGEFTAGHGGSAWSAGISHRPFVRRMEIGELS